LCFRNILIFATCFSRDDYVFLFSDVCSMKWNLWEDILIHVHIYISPLSSSHTALYSSNLLHGQIAQMHIDHLSGHKIKKCRHLEPLLLKSSGVWGWFIYHLFKGYIFILCPLRWSICIWAICPWNKFDEKAQCEVKCANLPNESNLKRNNFCTIKILLIMNLLLTMQCYQMR